MENAKAVNTPLPSHLKLTKEMCPKTQEEEDKMSKVPYASIVGSLMYAMVCTRLDIAHAVGVVSRYMSHPGIEECGQMDSQIFERNIQKVFTLWWL